MEKSRKIIILAVFTYIFLSPFFFHPDLKIIYHHSQFLVQGVWNIYEYLAKNPNQASLGQFVYPPLAYLFFGSVFPLINLFAGKEFIAWLGMGNTAVELSQIFRFIFLTKLPLILIHLLSGLILAKTQDPKDHSKILALWYFNPVSIYTVAVIGQFDVVPVLFTIIALYLAPKKPFVSALMLGIGAGLKTYPLLLIPFLGASVSGSLRKKVAVFAAGLLPYLVSIIPFLTSRAFLENVFSSGLSTRIFQVAIPIGFEKSLLLVPAALLLFFFFTSEKSASTIDLNHIFMSVVLIILAGSHFHPQWALWAVPFVVLHIAKTKNYWPGVMFCLAWLVVTLLFPDNFLVLGTLSPFDSQVLNLPPVSSILPSFLPWQNLAQTLFLASSLWLIFPKSAKK